MSDQLYDILRYAVITYWAIGLLVSLIGFLIVITNKENRDDIAKRGFWRTLFSFIKVAAEWPLIILDMILIRRSLRKIKKNWVGLLKELEKDTNAKERNDTRKH